LTGPPRDRLLAWTVGPGLLYLVVFFAVPFAIVGAFSLALPSPTGGVRGGFTLANYGRVLDPLYLSVLLRSALLALATTALSLLLAFPTAWAIRGMTRRRQALLLALIILPSWMNLLVKNYAWIVILRRQGVLNTLLGSLGITDGPLPLLFNDGAVVAGLVHTYLPFMLLPLYVAIEKIDRRLIEAATDLYASRVQAFWRVTFVLSLPGVVAGSLLTFIPAIGDFITAEVIGAGNPEVFMVGNIIQRKFLDSLDYPAAAALAFVLVAAVMALVTVYTRVVGSDRLAG
jgi:spermidine/putrescine transport system permease protein